MITSLVILIVQDVEEVLYFQGGKNLMEKKYIITESQINEINDLIRLRETMRIKVILKELEEFKDQVVGETNH